MTFPATCAVTAWTPSFYGYDGGNMRQLTNSAGAVTDSYEYDAFGNALQTSGSTPNNYLYRGEQYDSDLGLYYLRARYYNPLTGRFVSRDPNDPQPRENGLPTDPKSLHKYLYAQGDPVNGLDPSGRADEEDEGFIDASILRNVNRLMKYASAEKRLATCLTATLVWGNLTGNDPDKMWIYFVACMNRLGAPYN